MNFFRQCIFIFSTLFLVGCANNSPTDLQDNNIADIVTYKNTVKAIIDSNCINCHAAVPIAGAPMSLTTFEKVRASVLTMGTIDRMNRNPGDPLMMPLGSTKLSQAKIDAIVKWQAQGFQE